MIDSTRTFAAIVATVFLGACATMGGDGGEEFDDTSLTYNLGEHHLIGSWSGEDTHIEFHVLHVPRDPNVHEDRYVFTATIGAQQLEVIVNQDSLKVGFSPMKGRDFALGPQALSDVSALLERLRVVWEGMSYADGHGFCLRFAVLVGLEKTLEAGAVADFGAFLAGLESKQVPYGVSCLGCSSKDVNVDPCLVNSSNWHWATVGPTTWDCKGRCGWGCDTVGSQSQYTYDCAVHDIRCGAHGMTSGPCTATFPSTWDDWARSNCLCTNGES